MPTDELKPRIRVRGSRSTYSEDAMLWTPREYENPLTMFHEGALRYPYSTGAVSYRGFLGNMERSIYVFMPYSITIETENSLRELLASGVVIEDLSFVRDYLRRHTYMGDLLISVYKRAKVQFGEDMKLVLQVVDEPETGNDYLRLCIRRAQYDDDIIDNIEDIAREAYESLVGKPGWLLVTTDFVPLE